MEFGHACEFWILSYNQTCSEVAFEILTVYLYNRETLSNGVCFDST